MDGWMESKGSLLLYARVVRSRYTTTSFPPRGKNYTRPPCVSVLSRQRNDSWISITYQPISPHPSGPPLRRYVSCRVGGLCAHTLIPPGGLYISESCGPCTRRRGWGGGGFRWSVTSQPAQFHLCMGRWGVCAPGRSETATITVPS